MRHHLRERVARLDAGSGDPLSHAVNVLAETVDDGTPPPVGTPRDADAITAESRLLRELWRRCPQIVTGPLDRSAQWWISTGKPDHVRPSHPRLTPERFVAITADPSTKPFGMGLFTSTAPPGGRSMWRLYLDAHANSTLFPPPWLACHVPIRSNLRVRTITTARGWADLLTAYPMRRSGFVYPDWPAIAKDTDGIHLTLRAIVALQGFSFPTPNGPTAAAYWDVESTFWLRWPVD